MPGLHEQTVQITNKRGLHARAAAKFVKLVEQRKADVRVLKDDMDVCGSSIMGLLMLSASVNTAIKISVKGEDAKNVLDELVALVERRFDEGE
jgi:phosphocarrier protein HPr